MAQLISLTGVEISYPLPGKMREIRTNAGQAGGVVPSWKAVIYCNKLASIGSGSVDGYGDALDYPRLIQGGEAEVVARCGLKSEGLLLWRAFRAANPNTTDVALCIVAPGTGSATCDFTVANTATAPGTIRIDCAGESVFVGYQSGDTVATVSGLVRSAINAHPYWPVVGTGASPTVTATTSMAGTRHDHHINQMRITVLTPGTAVTVTKGAVTPGSTDDDFTTSIVNLENAGYFWVVNPKHATAGLTSTDNGIGEMAAAMANYVAPSSGKQMALVLGSTATVSQATAVAISVNQPWATMAHSEDNDWSPGMIAAHYCGALAMMTASNRGANLADYGVKNSADRFYVPDPYSKDDRATVTEQKTLVNNGVTPIAFSDSGKAKIVWPVSTKSLTNSVNDYRSRPFHTWLCACDYWETLSIELDSVMQPNVADDWSDKQKPIPGFSTPKDMAAVMRRVVDLKTGDGGPATLDPSQRQAMKDSVFTERQSSGLSGRIDIGAVRHNLRQWLLINEVSPSI